MEKDRDRLEQSLRAIGLMDNKGSGMVINNQEANKSKKTKGLLLMMIAVLLVGLVNNQGVCSPAAEARAWINLVKGMIVAPEGSTTLQKAVSFFNHYPRSANRGTVEYMIAEINFNQKRYKNAINYYRQIVSSQDPAMAVLKESALFRAGECYFNSGDALKANQMWEVLLSRFPKTYLRAEVEANRCQLLLKKGEYQQAEQHYRSLLSRYPHYRERDGIVAGLAQIDFAYGKYDQVLKRLQNRRTPEALYLKGRALFALNRFQEAANYFDKIVKYHSHHPYAFNATYLKAEAFFQNKNDSAAMLAFKDFLARYGHTPLAAFANFKMAAVLLRLGKYKQALVYSQRLVKDQNHVLIGFLWKYLNAEIMVGLKRYDQAGTYYRQILASSPPENIYEPCLIKYAWVLYKNGQYQNAINTAYRYLQSFGGRDRAILAQFIIANSYYFTRNYTKAIKTYHDVLMMHKYSSFLEIALIQMQITYMHANQINQIISQTASIVNAMEKNIKPVNRNYRAMALYFLAEAYYREHQPRNAIALYEKISTKYWDTTAMAYAKESLVWSLFSEERYDDALAEAGKVIRDRRIDKSVRESIELVKGHCLFNLKNYKAALGIYQRWLRKNPRNKTRLQVQYLMGLAYYRMKYYKNALTIWGKIIDRPQRNEYTLEALLKVADALFRGGDYSRAIHYYRLFITRYPKNSSVALAHLRIAQSYYNLQEDQKAIAEYNYFIKAFPNDESLDTAKEGIENTIFRSVKKHPGVAAQRRFLARYPKSKFSDQVQYQLAESFYKAKKFAEAIPEFNRLILNYPGSEAVANAMFYLGDCYDQLKRLPDATSTYSMFTETYPKNDLMPEVLSRLAADHYLMKNYEEAIKVYRKIVDSYPVKPYVEDALYNIAVVYDKMNRPSEAMAMYMDFVARYPRNAHTPDARIQIGIYYEDQQLWDLALNSFRQAMTGKNRKRPELYFRMGDCYENMNRAPLAMSTYEKVIALTPKTDVYRITALSQLAALYEKEQAWKKALSIYRDIAQNAPRQDWKQGAVERIKQIENP